MTLTKAALVIRYERTLGMTVMVGKGFYAPNDMAFGPDGRIYVLNRSIEAQGGRERHESRGVRRRGRVLRVVRNVRDRKRPVHLALRDCRRTGQQGLCRGRASEQDHHIRLGRGAHRRVGFGGRHARRAGHAVRSRDRRGGRPAGLRHLQPPGPGVHCDGEVPQGVWQGRIGGTAS